MSHSAARNLTLTEELEKLEQSITLTLQEIDSNFSRAHRIVTTSILPIVEQYAKHSEAVWEGSKFWKQFFEASANVSLSGYEEAVNEDTTTADETVTQTELSHGLEEEQTMTDIAITPPSGPQPLSQDEDDHATSILSSPSLAHAHSTPRMPRFNPNFTKNPVIQPTFAEYPSPYESLKQEIQGNTFSSVAGPSTPGQPASHTLPDMSMTPASSPFIQPPSTAQRYRNNDPILHRDVLDKTYRIAATPHTGRKQLLAHKTNMGTKASPNKTTRQIHQWDSSPLSSPELLAPQLRPELFSPLKTPRAPGLSIQDQSKSFSRGKPKTPIAFSLNKKISGDITSTVYQHSENKDDYHFKEDDKPYEDALTASEAQKRLWDSDSDFEEGLDFSPPKTMQFHIPQARLLQTPAREASKRIVQDLLLTAGGDITDELEYEDSPSIVKRNMEIDQTF